MRASSRARTFSIELSAVKTAPCVMARLAKASKNLSLPPPPTSRHLSTLFEERGVLILRSIRGHSRLSFDESTERKRVSNLKMRYVPLEAARPEKLSCRIAAALYVSLRFLKLSPNMMLYVTIILYRGMHFARAACSSRSLGSLRRQEVRPRYDSRE